VLQAALRIPTSKHLRALAEPLEPVLRQLAQAYQQAGNTAAAAACTQAAAREAASASADAAAATQERA
jgi:hypothetical protein